MTVPNTLVFAWKQRHTWDDAIYMFRDATLIRSLIVRGCWFSSFFIFHNSSFHTEIKTFKVKSKLYFVYDI